MTEQILFNKDASILLIEERERKDIVIGAPHHTLGGVKQMPCPEHMFGDENTGFIARRIAEIMNISSVIACNYRVDSNKNLRTDYSLQIAQWSPQYLIELHGHGAQKISDDTIEISSGIKERNEKSKFFAEILKSKFNNINSLKRFYINGDFFTIHFKAAKTSTIIDSRWTPFHIELPPSMRLDTSNNLPPFIEEAIECMVETITQVCT